MAARRGAKTTEGDVIALLERVLAAGRAPGVLVGIGDDAAVLGPQRQKLVWTVDTNVAGVHFDRRWLSWADVGWRSLQAAVSDLAAMGATPVAALSSLILPPGLRRADVEALGRGQAEAAAQLGCPVIGGNIARGGELSVTTTVLGRAARPLLRSTARAGDELWLLGDVGLAAAGLELLRRGARQRDRATRACIAAWRRPRALIAEGLTLSGRASAAMDISDGLSGDALKLAAASAVRVVIDEALLEAALPSALSNAARGLGSAPIELALRGGEDYALLATGASKRRPSAARVIGRVERGRGAELLSARRTTRPLGAGFDHFR